jgi:hypothetical protein
MSDQNNRAQRLPYLVGDMRRIVAKVCDGDTRVAVHGVQQRLLEHVEDVFAGERHFALFPCLCYLFQQGCLGFGVSHIRIAHLSIFLNLSCSGCTAAGVLWPVFISAL